MNAFYLMLKDSAEAEKHCLTFGRIQLLLPIYFWIKASNLNNSFKGYFKGYVVKMELP